MARTLSTREAVDAAQGMKNAFSAFQHIEAVLEAAAGAEQAARETNDRRLAAEIDIRTIRAEAPKARYETELAIREIAEKRAAVEAEHARFQAEATAQREGLQAEIRMLVEQRDTLDAAVEQLKIALAKTAAVTA